MIEFLTTTGIAAQIENIIRNADRKIVLVSPYLKFTTNFIQRLQSADRRGVEITVVYGKKDLSEKAENALRKLDLLELYFYEDLHAKCYFSEQSMVITSMNLYEFSEKNNREMGVYVTSDETVFEQAEREAQSIINHAEEQSLKRSIFKFSFRKKRESRSAQKRAYCIRCKQNIAHNPEAPYCKSCYATWARWEDPSYAEKYCHSCGSQTETSMQKPQCYKCYKAAVT